MRASCIRANGCMRVSYLSKGRASLLPRTQPMCRTEPRNPETASGAHDSLRLPCNTIPFPATATRDVLVLTLHQNARAPHAFYAKRTSSIFSGAKPPTIPHACGEWQTGPSGHEILKNWVEIWLITFCITLIGKYRKTPSTRPRALLCL